MQISRRHLLAGGAACAAAAAIPPTRLLAADTASLDAIARTRGLRFGTALSADHLENPLLAKTIASQCSVITPENELKWKHLQPAAGKWRAEQALRLAEYAKTNQLALRGHTFVWNQDNRIPQWLVDREAEFTGPGGIDKLIALMWDHADFLAKTFPEIRSWDAVNEVVELGSGKVRSSLFSRVLGEKLVDVGFAMMREKMPQAQMVYNDYMSWDAKASHRDGVLRMLERALGRGVKIDALGIQSHLAGSLNRKIDELAWRKFLEDVQGMGLKVIITELDCGDRNLTSTDIGYRDRKTADFVKAYLDLTLSFTNVTEVVTWSLSDFDTYMNRRGYPDERRRVDRLPMRGHPYDEAIAPKPMRDAIAVALAAAPLRSPDA